MTNDTSRGDRFLDPGEKKSQLVPQGLHAGFA